MKNSNIKLTVTEAWVLRVWSVTVLTTLWVLWSGRLVAVRNWRTILLFWRCFSFFLSSLSFYFALVYCSTVFIGEKVDYKTIASHWLWPYSASSHLIFWRKRVIFGNCSSYDSNYFKSIRQVAARYAFIDRSTRFQLFLAKYNIYCTEFLKF